MVAIVAAAACLAAMALFIAGSWWYFRRIRDGRADPVISPSWPSTMWPASPPAALHDAADRRDEM
jgi:hypothetical protein